MSARAAAPRSLPPSTWTGLLLAAVLVGVGVVTIHDLASSLGWTSEASWTATTVARADGLTADSRVAAAAVVLVVVGLLLVLVALRPARRTHRPGGTEDVWVGDGAVRALAGAAARDTAGVADATVRVGRRRVVVSVRSNRDDVTGAVEANVERSLAGLSGADVRVSARPVAE